MSETETELMIPRKKRIRIFIIIIAREIAWRFLKELGDQQQDLDNVDVFEDDLTEQQMLWLDVIAQSTKPSDDPQVVEVSCCQEDSRLAGVFGADVGAIVLVPVDPSGAVWNIKTVAEGDLAQEVCDGFNGLAQLAA